MADHDIIVLGAGLGGIGMGVQLKQAGLTDFLILEKETSAGGTWRDNVYPGAACDTESHLYCFSFDLHLGVSRMYARQPELLAYAQGLVDTHGLADHIRYGVEITAADWDEATAEWRIALSSGGVVTARVFIAAWGQLNRPQTPDIPGLADFRGQAFHSARWPADLVLSGKRVASIGNAASAVQYIPEIASEVDRLLVFQRSPNWIVPRGDRPYSQQELLSFKNEPGTFAASQAALFAWRETTFLRMREGSEEAREIEAQARRHLDDQVSDPELRARLTPDFPLGCKRVLRSDDYFPALMRDNVDLVTEAIVRVTPDGIEAADGQTHVLDVIIFGTGFETQSFQGPVDVTGRDARSLREVWAEGAHAYLGMTVSGFPNFFMLYGPNTNLGHNSILSMLEAQYAYILQALADRRGGALDVRDAVMQAFNDDLQTRMDGSAWSGNCNSWYKNAAGRVINNWAGPVQEYRDATGRFERADYEHLTPST